MDFFVNMLNVDFGFWQKLNGVETVYLNDSPMAALPHSERKESVALVKSPLFARLHGNFNLKLEYIGLL